MKKVGRLCSLSVKYRILGMGGGYHASGFLLATAFGGRYTFVVGFWAINPDIILRLTLVRYK